MIDALVEGRGVASVAVPTAPASRRLAPLVLVLAVVLAIVWFGGLGHRDLIKPDEGRYAEIPREMVATGDWLTPRLNGLKYFEKPPLQYWATAVAYEVFGIEAWTSRLWAALTGFAAIVVTGFAAARLWGSHVGLYAATVLASSLAFVLLGHFNTLDMGLTFFLAATLAAVMAARDALVRGTDPTHCGASVDASTRAAGLWVLVAWAALALAVLSKGPVALVLCGLGLSLYLVASRDWPMLKLVLSLRGIGLFLLIAAPWFIAVSRANPEFARFFFIHEHVERFLTDEHRRSGPPWYFVPVVAAGLLPWLGLAFTGWRSAWRAPARGTFRPERLLVAWTIAVFAFFSASGSKLPSYVLPLFPSIAMLAALELKRIDARTLVRHLAAVAMLAVVAFVAVCFIERWTRFVDPPEAVSQFKTIALTSLGVWCVGTVVGALLARRDRGTLAVVAAGLAALVAWSGILLGHQAIGRGMSTAVVAQRIASEIVPDTTVYSVGLFEHSLDFYLGRTVQLVSFRDELDFGLSQEPSKYIATIEQFAARWQAERAPVAVMAPDTYATLVAMKLPMRVLVDDRRRIVVAKPAPAGPSPAR